MCHVALELTNPHPGDDLRWRSGWRATEGGENRSNAIHIQKIALYLLDCYSLFGFDFASANTAASSRSTSHASSPTTSSTPSSALPLNRSTLSAHDPLTKSTRIGDEGQSRTFEARFQTVRHVRVKESKITIESEGQGQGGRERRRKERRGRDRVRE